MKHGRMYIPEDIPDLLDLLGSMILRAPKFLDKTGYMPFWNLDYVFTQLSEGLSVNRSKAGEERYHELTRMSAQIRALFEADPDDKTGQTLEGCKIIHRMEDILREARRKAR
jgi:hypothetical protein